MIVVGISSLKAPRCAKCDDLTKLCSSPVNPFVFVWRCKPCETDYNYHTGDEIVTHINYSLIKPTCS